MSVRCCITLLFALGFLIAGKASAEELYAAVASNFSAPFEEIAAQFSEETDIRVKPIYASTGKLFAMISNGAPFDLFLAADSQRPALLHDKDLAAEPFVYAYGSPVLWSNDKDICTASNWQEALQKSGNNQIVIANPEVAPYGTSVMKVLETFSLDHLSRRLIYSQNVAQAFALSLKVTGIGFTSASMVKTPQGLLGCYWPINQAEKVEQSGCVITNREDRQSSEKLALYLTSPPSKIILSNYGYYE